MLKAISFDPDQGTVTLGGSGVRRGDSETTLTVRVIRKISPSYWLIEPVSGRTWDNAPMPIRGRALNYCECRDMECVAPFASH